jgi:hypothetical protein
VQGQQQTKKSLPDIENPACVTTVLVNVSGAMFSDKVVFIMPEHHWAKIRLAFLHKQYTNMFTCEK